MSLFLKKLLGIGFQIYTFSKLFSNVKFCDHTKLLSTINTVHGLSPKACLKPSSKNMESERNRGGSMLLGLNLQPLQTIQRHYIYRKEQNMFLVSRSCTTAQWLMFRMTAKHNILHRLLKIVCTLTIVSNILQSCTHLLTHISSYACFSRIRNANLYRKSSWRAC